MKTKTFFLAILFWLENNKPIPMLNNWIYAKTRIPMQEKQKELEI